MVAVGDDVFGAEPDLRSDLLNGTEFSFLCDLDIGFDDGLPANGVGFDVLDAKVSAEVHVAQCFRYAPRRIGVSRVLVA